MPSGPTYEFDSLPTILDNLKKKIKLAIVHGGDKNKKNAVLRKTNNPRSWKSYEVVAHDIANALGECGFKNIEVMPDDLSLLPNLKKKKIDLVWLNTGGVQGYIPTSHAAAMLEMSGIPYIGHNPLNAAILDNKHVFKFMLQNFQFPTARFLVWSRSPLKQDSEADWSAINKTFGDYQGPFIVKPTSGRASLNVQFIPSRNELFNTINQVYKKTQNHIVIEKYLAGREFCVSVCGPTIQHDGTLHNTGAPFAFSILERVLDEDEKIFTSMDKKPITTSRTRIIDKDNESELYQRLKTMAQDIYSAFSLETLVRIDMRMNGNRDIYILEANPKPDLKRPGPNVTSLTCAGLSRHNMEYTDLITSLLADRLDYLMTYRKGNIEHITKLLPGVNNG